MKPFIIFFGPEGAGKTTQIRMLIKELQDKYGKQNVEVISIRDNHLLIPLVAKLLVRMGFFRYFSYGDGKIVKVADVQRVVRNKCLWSAFQFLNLLPLIFVKYYVKRKLFRKLLIADRFIPDSICTLAHFMNNMNILDTRIGRLYLKLIPQDAYLIFLFAPYEILVHRYKNRGSLVEPEDLIRYEITVGQMLVRLLHTRALAINTATKTPEETLRLIKKFLNKSIS